MHSINYDCPCVCASVFRGLTCLVLPVQLSSSPGSRVGKILDDTSRYASSSLMFESYAIGVGHRICNCSQRHSLGNFASGVGHSRRSLGNSVGHSCRLRSSIIVKRDLLCGNTSNGNFVRRTKCDKLVFVDSASINLRCDFCS